MKFRTFIAAALIVTMGGILYAQNAEDFEILQKQDGNVTITGYNGTLSSVVIPSAIFGQIVDAIGSGAFSENVNLRSVSIPETVIQIGNSAFQGDPNLTSVTFGGGLLHIGDFAFAYDALKLINLPDRLISIGNSAFTGNDLSYLIIPDSVQRIGSNAFADNPHLSSIVLGGNLESVYYNAFGMPDNPVTLITVKKAGIDFSGIDLDQNFINIYNGENGGAGVYNKRGNAWLKSSSDTNSFNPAESAPETTIVEVKVETPPEPPSVNSEASNPSAPPATPARPAEQQPGLARTDAPRAGPGSPPPPETNNKPAPPKRGPAADKNRPPPAKGSRQAAANIVGKTFVVYFPKNSSSFYDLEPELAAENSKVFNMLIAALKANPNYKVRISGFVNGINPTAREERTMLVPLSLDRAKTVAAFLNYNGIEKNRIKLSGYGSSSPVTGKRTNRQLNRRAEITVIE